REMASTTSSLSMDGTVPINAPVAGLRHSIWLATYAPFGCFDCYRETVSCANGDSLEAARSALQRAVTGT
ncbi:MAG TPA: hypothetical protein VMU77_05965, partial [Acidimicrobiales bacterium]|nr:hypothetical protein [Acidimicrobiales bacterium]